jgi:hypothetical protein
MAQPSPLYSNRPLRPSKRAQLAPLKTAHLQVDLPSANSNSTPTTSMAGRTDSLPVLVATFCLAYCTLLAAWVLLTNGAILGAHPSIFVQSRS